MGPIEVPVNALWGAQTQRSLGNFKTAASALPMIGPSASSKCAAR